MLDHFALPGDDDHPAARASAGIAADLLAPHAATADDPTRGVDPTHLDALVKAGLRSTRGPVAEGGHGADELVDAAVVEHLCGACGTTWFLTTQHRFPQGPTRGPLAGLPAEAIMHGPAAERQRAGPAAATTTRAGIAIAPPRRPGPPAVRAEPAGSGRTFHGTADGRFVLALPPAEQRWVREAPFPLVQAQTAGVRVARLRAFAGRA